MSATLLAVFVARMADNSVLLVQAKDGLWTLPAAASWDGTIESIAPLATGLLGKYFTHAKISKVRLLAYPSEMIDLGHGPTRCAVFDFCLSGAQKEDMSRKMWRAQKMSLVPQVITPEMRCIINLSEVQSCLE